MTTIAKTNEKVGVGGLTQSQWRMIRLTLSHIFLIFYSIVSVYILIRVFSVSIRPSSALLSTDLWPIPQNAQLWMPACTAADGETTGCSSYQELLIEEDFILWLWNSFAITTTVAICGVVVAATGAYAFSRWQFPGKRPFLVFLLTTQMIPAGMLLIPIFMIIAQLNLQGNIFGLMLAYISGSVPFSVWVLKGYYDTIPPDLEEAAMVDGCNRLEAFWRVIIPITTPALSIVFLFNFLSAWSEYIIANAILGQTPGGLTWPLGLNDLIGQFSTDWGKYAAGSIIVTVPMVLLFMSQSKYLIGGLTAGGVKG
jgi:arabinogalactan oligomer / maltooligosaccharide transport system permease protein